MKISAKQYARILWDSIKEEESRKEEIVANFVKVLFKKRQFRLEGQIIEALKEIEKKETGLVEAEVVSPFEVKDKEKKEIEKFIKKNLDCKEVEIDFKTDKELIGGLVVKAEGYVWDMSVLGGIKKLNKAIK